MNATTLAAIRLYRQRGIIPTQAELTTICGHADKTTTNHLKAAVKAGWLISYGHGLYVPAEWRLVASPLRVALDELGIPSWLEPDAGKLAQLAAALSVPDVDDAEAYISIAINRAWTALADEEARRTGGDPRLARTALREEYSAEEVVDPAAWRAADAVLTWQDDAVDAAAVAAYAAVGEAVTRARCLRLG